MCLPGALVTFLSLTQEAAGLSPAILSIFEKKISAEYKEN